MSDDPFKDLRWVNAGYVTPQQAVNLASKLLQFATQANNAATLHAPQATRT